MVKTLHFVLHGQYIKANLTQGLNGELNRIRVLLIFS